jgi:hypothetical protein
MKKIICVLPIVVIFTIVFSGSGHSSSDWAISGSYNSAPAPVVVAPAPYNGYYYGQPYAGNYYNPPSPGYYNQPAINLAFGYANFDRGSNVGYWPYYGGGYGRPYGYVYNRPYYGGRYYGPAGYYGNRGHHGHGH